MSTNMLKVWEVKKPAYFVLPKCPMISWTMQLFQNAVSIVIPIILFSKNCLGNLEFPRHTYNITHLKLMFSSTDVLPPKSLCWHCQTQKADWAYIGVTRPEWHSLCFDIKNSHSCYWSVVLLSSSATVSHCRPLSGLFP